MNRLAAYVLAALGFGIYGAVTGVDRDEAAVVAHHRQLHRADAAAVAVVVAMTISP